MSWQNKRHSLKRKYYERRVTMITFVSTQQIKLLLNELTTEEQEKLVLEKFNELPETSKAKLLKELVQTIQPQLIFEQMLKVYKVKTKRQQNINNKFEIL